MDDIEWQSASTAAKLDWLRQQVNYAVSQANKAVSESEHTDPGHCGAASGPEGLVQDARRQDCHGYGQRRRGNWNGYLRAKDAINQAASLRLNEAAPLLLASRINHGTRVAIIGLAKR